MTKEEMMTKMMEGMNPKDMMAIMHSARPQMMDISYLKSIRRIAKRC